MLTRRAQTKNSQLTCKISSKPYLTQISSDLRSDCAIAFSVLENPPPLGFTLPRLDLSLPHPLSQKRSIQPFSETSQQFRDIAASYKPAVSSQTPQTTFPSTPITPEPSSITLHRSPSIPASTGLPAAHTACIGPSEPIPAL